MIGDFLYGLSGRDGSLPRLEPRFARSSKQANQAQFTGSMVVPNDRVMLVHGASILANGAGGTTVANLRIVVADASNGFELFDLARSTPGIAVGSLHWVGQPLPLLGGDHLLNYFIDFSAANAGNNVFISAAGFQLPRGNVLSGAPGTIFVN